MPQVKSCTDCGEQFTPYHGKPGFIGQCPACGAGDVPVVGGNMVWAHKTAPELEIKSMPQAKLFAKLTARHGAGPLRSITTSKMTPDTMESGKQGSGTEDRAQYFSRLGEKRTVKL